MKLAVLGPGLLGASIALACRRLPETSVALWGRRAEAVIALQERGMGDFASTNLAAVVEGGSQGCKDFCPVARQATTSLGARSGELSELRGVKLRLATLRWRPPFQAINNGFDPFYPLAILIEMMRTN